MTTDFQDGFPATVVKPLAQIIMLDAAHGDSNIIDMCVKDLKSDNSYADDSWQRVLIDTGPGDEKTRENLVRVIKTYKQPMSPGGHQPLATGAQPIVNMVQFTHTDEDHCGGGKALFEALAADADLQRHFAKTVVAFHRLPKQNPEWSLRFYKTVPASASTPLTVECWPSAWTKYNKGIDLEKFNVHLKYTFRINDVDRAISSSPTVLITDAEIAHPKTQLTVNCRISLYRHSTAHNTTQLFEFNLRKAHKDIFAVTEYYNIVPQADGSRVLGLSTKRRSPSPPPLPDADPKKDKPYDPVTKQKVPNGEKRRANQMYYRIEEGLETVLSQDTVRRAAGNTPFLDPVLWSPVQNESHTSKSGLATMEIVGPTPTIYNELIGDIIRVEYDQGVFNPKVKDPQKTDDKDSVLHNMGSIVTLFRRWPTEAARGSSSILSMIFTGDAHDRECQIRNTVDAFAGASPPRSVNVLKIPHHGSLHSTSVEFYNRINSNVYLVCARQNNHGSPSLRILEAMVSHTTQRGSPTAHLFFSNPDSLWNVPLPEEQPKPRQSVPSNLNILLSGKKKPGADGFPFKYNYKCYILKHRVQGAWTKDSKPANKEKNGGMILLGRDSTGDLVITANEMWWDIWDEHRIKNATPGSADDLESYKKMRP